MPKRSSSSEAAAAAAPVVDPGPPPDPLLEAAYRNDPNTRELCEHNGVKEKVFVRDAGSVTHLDLFQSQCTNMKAVRYFPNLVCLQILQQGSVSEIVGLGTLRHLTSLWITQCSLTEIVGLEGLVSLKQLHLSSNKISKIDGVRDLRSLEVLWLNDNRLTAIDSLSALPRLRQLWLARNRIEAIGAALDANTALEELNLADNKIGCFKELLHLGRLPRLRALSFCDPHFGDNPVCGLCNYQTYVLYHLRQLASIDTMTISDEAKATAEATYMKKKMCVLPASYADAMCSLCHHPCCAQHPSTSHPSHYRACDSYALMCAHMCLHLPNAAHCCSLLLTAHVGTTTCESRR